MTGLDKPLSHTESDASSKSISPVSTAHPRLRAETPHCCATMIGDGATDLEAAEAADCFIGYGGVQYRPGIEAEAMLYVSDFTMLHNIYLSARSA